MLNTSSVCKVDHARGVYDKDMRSMDAKNQLAALVGIGHVVLAYPIFSAFL